MLIPSLLLAVLPQAQRPTADSLLAEASTLVPAYAYAPRERLSESARADTEAAAHLAAAAVALAPEDLRALWTLGHLEGELAVDAEHTQERARHFVRSIAALSRAIELAPEDAWAPFARAMTYLHAGDVADPEKAEADLRLALEHIESARATGDGSLDFLRYKVLETLPEVSMRLGLFDRAREELTSFHGEFSNNAWPLGIALAECDMRERDLGAARGRYDELIAGFASDPQAYALRGYVHGLLGDRESATRDLAEAVKLEVQPGLYSRLWLWILATDERREAARADLAAFASNPPDSVSEWDRTLGRFVLGEGDEGSFLNAAREEVARRVEAGEAVDELLCEAWYYVGVRYEREGEPQAAMIHYMHAIEIRPTGLKWEWAFARAGYASAVQALVQRGSEWAPPELEVKGEVERSWWHAVGAESPTTESLHGPGDLWLGWVRVDGQLQAVRWVVGTNGSGKPR